MAGSYYKMVRQLNPLLISIMSILKTADLAGDKFRKKECLTFSNIPIISYVNKVGKSYFLLCLTGLLTDI